MVFYQLTNPHHQLEMGVFRGDPEDIGTEAIVFAQTLFEIFKLGNDEQVIRVPV